MEISSSPTLSINLSDVSMYVHMQAAIDFSRSSKAADTPMKRISSDQPGTTMEHYALQALQISKQNQFTN